MMMLEDSHEWVMWQASQLGPAIVAWNDSAPPIPDAPMEVVAPKRKRKPSAWATCLQKRVNRWVKGANDDKLASMLGFSRGELIDHMERQFTRGMSWSSYAGNRKFKAKGTWVIDHVVPKSRFKQGEAKEAFALSNLRPLCIKKNLSKNIQRTHLL